MNQAACVARFLVREVLGQTDRRPPIPLGKRGRSLPEVLSRAEVATLLDAPGSCKVRTFLQTACASGLRVSELCGLRVCDIDSAADRMCIGVVNGNGGHDCYALLSPDLLAHLRQYWLTCRRGAARAARTGCSPRSAIPHGRSTPAWPSASTMPRATPRASPSKAASTCFESALRPTCWSPALTSTASAS